MPKKNPGRPALDKPILVEIRVRGLLAERLKMRGRPVDVVRRATERYLELMLAPILFLPDVVRQADELCQPIYQRVKNPRGHTMTLGPVDPLSLNLIDAWYLVATRGYDAQVFLSETFDGNLDVTGIGRPADLWRWSLMLDGLSVARNHPDYATDPLAAYRAAGLCA